MDERLIKYFSGELSNSELLVLLDQIDNDPELKDEFIRLQNLHVATQLSKSSEDNAIGKSKYILFSRETASRSRIQLFKAIFQYAAVAIILIASSVWTTLYVVSHQQDEELNELYVPAGQRARLTLQDGSTVWLNAQSTLKYPVRFTRKSRTVDIVGEGYFDIAKDKKRPFIVSSQGVDMKVLGTQFNVYSYPEMGCVKTDLIEGSLKVYPKGGEQDAITLKPNEQLTINEDGMHLSQSVFPDYFLWKDGIYSFEDERLLDILEKLQLYYDLKIIVEDPEIFETRYTGKFRQRDGIEGILRIIQKIKKFNIKKDPEKNTITLTS